MVVKHTQHRVDVHIHKTHYGHRLALGHLRIPESEKVAIAGKLAQGVQVQHILDSIRDSLGSCYKRIHLLTRKDITNIDRAYCLSGIRRHKDDATSVNLWVEEMKGTEDNPVLLYKPQGSAEQGCDNLLLEDFLLVLQTPLQQDMLKKFSQDRVVCVDGTHGTNGYNFVLITLLVVDEYGEGFPVGWCISNREDQAVLGHFFKAIKGRVGNISARWFMSDLAEQYYSAWSATFTCSAPRRLLCVWHVDKAWRENIRQLDDGMRITVYHNLRVLLEETDPHKFEVMLHKTIENWETSPDTTTFAGYFVKHYATRKEEWAACYRLDAPVNTNMYVEAFHRVLKYLYLKGKTNKRLDRCIGVLLKVSRDKGFERLVKLEKGKCSERTTQIQARHRASLNLSPKNITQSEEYNTWTVVSEDKKNHIK